MVTFRPEVKGITNNIKCYESFPVKLIFSVAKERQCKRNLKKNKQKAVKVGCECAIILWEVCADFLPLLLILSKSENKVLPPV